MRASAILCSLETQNDSILDFVSKTEPAETITILDKICAAKLDFLVSETQRLILERIVSEIEPAETITFLDKICAAELDFLVSETFGSI